MTDTTRPDTFGPNEWLVEEMFERYRADPASVGPSWQEFFANYRQTTAPPRSAAAQTVEAPADGARPAVSTGDGGGAGGGFAGAPVGGVGARPSPIKGVPARIDPNREAGL